MLAVSVGINLLVFTVVNALWIRPLPFPEPERVVTILQEMPWTSVDSPRLRIFEGGVAGQVETTGYDAGLRPQIEIAGQVPETLGVTSGYFRVLGLTIRGHDFTPEDEQDGAEPVAIISDSLWLRSFGRRPDMIGAVLHTKPLSIRVIGVAPPSFEGARRGERADLWIPTSLVRRLAPADWKGNPLPLMVFARLGPGQTAPINSVGSWSFVLARANLPDDVAYRLAKTLHGAEADLCRKLAQACETTAANTVAAAPKPELIHPGVLKYFREIGLVK